MLADGHHSSTVSVTRRTSWLEATFRFEGICFGELAKPWYLSNSKTHHNTVRGSSEASEDGESDCKEKSCCGELCESDGVNPMRRASCIVNASFWRQSIGKASRQTIAANQSTPINPRSRIQSSELPVLWVLLLNLNLQAIYSKACVCDHYRSSACSKRERFVIELIELVICFNRRRV